MRYMMWLIQFISAVNEPDISFNSLDYMTLLENLFISEFVPSNGDEYLDDYNRVQDGVNLRTTYIREHPEVFMSDSIKNDFISKPCSILEMLIALSIKIEDIMANDEYGDRTSKWFWTMLNNWLTPITDFSDLNWSVYTSDWFNNHVIRLYEHDYGINGECGLFYIPPNCACGSIPDMRYLPIWYQMQTYLLTIPN